MVPPGAHYHFRSRPVRPHRRGAGGGLTEGLPYWHGQGDEPAGGHHDRPGRHRHLQWSDHQAALLRRRAAGELVDEAELDWPNIAEEIESLGKSQSRELSSRIVTIILHLMKLQASLAAAPRAGWRDTILEQRDEIERLLADAPSLRARIPSTIAAEMQRARRRAEAARRSTASRLATTSTLSHTPRIR